jgi:hypothetical protein
MGKLGLECQDEIEARGNGKDEGWIREAGEIIKGGLSILATE